MTIVFFATNGVRKAVTGCQIVSDRCQTDQTTQWASTDWTVVCALVESVAWQLIRAKKWWVCRLFWRYTYINLLYQKLLGEMRSQYCHNDHSFSLAMFIRTTLFPSSAPPKTGMEPVLLLCVLLPVKELQWKRNKSRSHFTLLHSWRSKAPASFMAWITESRRTWPNCGTNRQKKQVSRRERQERGGGGRSNQLMLMTTVANLNWRSNGRPLVWQNDDAPKNMLMRTQGKKRQLA